MTKYETYCKSLLEGYCKCGYLKLVLGKAYNSNSNLVYSLNIYSQNGESMCYQDDGIFKNIVPVFRSDKGSCYRDLLAIISGKHIFYYQHLNDDNCKKIVLDNLFFKTYNELEIKLTIKGFLL